jgi:hypothetical protein
MEKFKIISKSQEKCLSEEELKEYRHKLFEYIYRNIDLLKHVKIDNLNIPLLSKFEELKLSRNERLKYQRGLHRYICENIDKLKSIRFRKLLHPVILSKYAEFKLTRDELHNYKRNLREYLFLNNAKIRGIRFRKMISPIMTRAMGLPRKIDKHTIEIIGDEREKTKRPVIFAVTHVGKFDIERANEALKKPNYLLCGDPQFMYKTFDGWFLEAKGVTMLILIQIWIDTFL